MASGYINAREDMAGYYFSCVCVLLGAATLFALNHIDFDQDPDPGSPEGRKSLAGDSAHHNPRRSSGLGNLGAVMGVGNGKQHPHPPGGGGTAAAAGLYGRGEGGCGSAADNGGPVCLCPATLHQMNPSEQVRVLQTAGLAPG